MLNMIVEEAETRETDVVNARSPEELADIVRAVAASHSWLDRVRLQADRRWYGRLDGGSDYDVWLISWMPGQSTGFHDHGASSGAFALATGTLEEHRPGEVSQALTAGTVRTFGPGYAHDVRNASGAPAISIHAYSPPLTEMNAFELQGDELVRKATAARPADSLDPRERIAEPNARAATTTRRIDGMLERARANLHRLSPQAAQEAVSKNGAVLVDIRPDRQRAEEGSIEGAWVIERNVLEWRFDPTSEARLPIADNHDLQVIVFCSEGYTSSLAAAALQQLGLWRATDIVGGIKAWQKNGLPVISRGQSENQTRS